jgi:DNA-binding beta-propeller fold protein YncE
MAIRQLEWTRGNARIALDPDRILLDPLLRRTSLVRVGLGVGPYGAVYGGAFDGYSVWFSTAVSLVKISIETNSVRASLYPGAVGGSVAFDGTFIWAAQPRYGRVKKIDPVTNVALADVTVGGAPSGVAFDGSRLWVANANGGIAAIDVASNAVVQATLLTVGALRGIVFDGLYLWVAKQYGSVLKVDPYSGTLENQVPTGTGEPWGVTFDGSHVWVTSIAPVRLTKIDPVANAVVASLSTVFTPSAGGFQGLLFDGQNLWVSTIAGLVKVDVASNTVIGSRGVGRGPDALVFDGTHVWAGSAGVANKVFALD